MFGVLNCLKVDKTTCCA